MKYFECKIKLSPNVLQILIVLYLNNFIFSLYIYAHTYSFVYKIKYVFINYKIFYQSLGIYCRNRQNHDITSVYWEHVIAI